MIEAVIEFAGRIAHMVLMGVLFNAVNLALSGVNWAIALVLNKLQSQGPQYSLDLSGTQRSGEYYEEIMREIGWVPGTGGLWVGDVMQFVPDRPAAIDGCKAYLRGGVPLLTSDSPEALDRLNKRISGKIEERKRANYLWSRGNKRYHDINPMVPPRDVKIPVQLKTSGFDRILISGPVGSGKRTMVRAISQRLNRDVVLIRTEKCTYKFLPMEIFLGEECQFIYLIDGTEVGNVEEMIRVVNRTVPDWFTATVIILSISPVETTWKEIKLGYLSREEVIAAVGIPGWEPRADAREVTRGVLSNFLLCEPDASRVEEFLEDLPVEEIEPADEESAELSREELFELFCDHATRMPQNFDAPVALRVYNALFHDPQLRNLICSGNPAESAAHVRENWKDLFTYENRDRLYKIYSGTWKVLPAESLKLEALFMLHLWVQWCHNCNHPGNPLAHQGVMEYWMSEDKYLIAEIEDDSEVAIDPTTADGALSLNCAFEDRALRTLVESTVSWDDDMCNRFLEIYGDMINHIGERWKLPRLYTIAELHADLRADALLLVICILYQPRACLLRCWVGETRKKLGIIPEDTFILIA